MRTQIHLPGRVWAISAGFLKPSKSLWKTSINFPITMSIMKIMHSNQIPMPNSRGLRNHKMGFMKTRLTRKKIVQIWLKFFPLLPYLLDTLYWAVVNFPVSGSCTVARLSYKKRERTRAYSRSRQFGAFVLFCQATGDWKGSDWSGW